METTGLTIEQEQAEFDRQLDELLKDQAGKFVLFKGGKPQAYFDNFEKAYEAGLCQFGVDATFLIMPVQKQPPQPISLSLEAGVMFG